MAAKSNIRSFRYSDAIARILEQQPGDSLNAKFEHLVESCYCQLEQRKQELDRINKQIDQCREVLRSLESATWEFNQLEQDIKAAKSRLGIVSRRAASIADKVDGL